ncbi:MAG: murein biosynthesis integral membrane protein MurJ [Bacteroidota bacterium]
MDETPEPDPTLEQPPADAPPGSPTADAQRDAPKQRSGSAAALVAAGILLSRISGLVREKAVAYFFGVGAHLDVYQLVMRGANLINNLLGEGTLSASFIPIYSRMLAEGRERDAGRFAGAIFGLLVLVAASIVAVGLLAAPVVVAVLAPGFLDDAELVQAGEIAVDRYALAVGMFRIALPMAALLALSAWALGVLNSHRRFLLPYAAPVMMNASVIAALVFMASRQFDNPFGIGALDVIPVATLNALLWAAVVGALVGGALQFLIQLPVVLRLLRGFRFSVSRKVEGVREALRAFGPVLAGRGVYQFSSYLDTILAGLATAGTLGALRPALVLYLLPVSLFGMSVAASELPELSRISQARLSEFLGRVNRSVRQMLFLLIPTVVVYVGFGLLVVGLLFGGGAFGLDDTWLVYLILAGYSLGLAATAVSRLLQNSFYALSDTRTPAKIAVARVAVSGVLGAALMFWLDTVSLPDFVGVFGGLPAGGRPLTLAAVGLALGSAVGAWVELLALRWALRTRLDGFELPWGRALQVLGLAGLAAIPAALVRWALPPTDVPFAVHALAVLAAFGVTYLGLAVVFRFEEGDAWLGRFLKRRRSS